MSNEKQKPQIDKKEQQFLADHALPAGHHPVSPRLMSRNALAVTRTLKAAGYQAYIVGGAVRDIYMDTKPKDFDVATNATPEQVRALFSRNARIIGKRFKIVHVTFAMRTPRAEIIEVTTFRGSGDAVSSSENPDKNTARIVSAANGMLVRDNTFGTIMEDVDRRDFTINALYYDPLTDTVYDFHDGISDLANGRIDIIGDPGTRYHEDPVRMLRAIRFSGKLDMEITPRTRDPIYSMGRLLVDVSNARMYDEMGKMLLTGNALKTFELMRMFNLVRYIFPDLDALLNSENGGMWQKFLNLVFKGTDDRIRANRKPNSKFLFACLLWPVLVTRIQDQIDLAGGFVRLSKRNETDLYDAMDTVLSRQFKHTAYPHFVFEDIEIFWKLLVRMHRSDTSEKRLAGVLTNTNLKGAYDFLVYWNSVNGRIQPVVDYWVGQFRKVGINYADASPGVRA
ncbi:MAG: polynucleotide adenylyltransferase PcnB [Succinivibrionaceae bacterium]|nr:polynucleotide adenylyltransferase PcnB [Succinivibrionaceae bacterium]